MTSISTAWHARVQPLDPGWVDLAYAVPLLDTTHALTELGWAPTRDARSVLAETLDGMRRAASSATPPLRPRTVMGTLVRAARCGPVSSRRTT